MCRAVLIACAVALLSGCGSSGKDDVRNSGPPVAGATQSAQPTVTAPLTPNPPTQQTTPQQTAPPAAAGPRLPGRVPRRADAAADPADASVVRRWSAALRRGELARAAAYFAQPSKVQNGTPVVTLHSRLERLAFNASFPCGAVPTRYGASRGFTIVTFRLTERVGGDCKGAAGHRARSAIRVSHGHIAEWYRLADPAKPNPPDQPLSTAGGEV
jgi:hypothetical protein